MKLITALALFCPLIFSCNNNDKSAAEKKQQEISTMADQTSAGMVSTTDNGYFMKAEVNGSEWTAATMLQHEDATSSYKEVKGERGRDYIMFQLSKKTMTPGRVTKMDKIKGIRLGWNNDLFSSEDGELTVTKNDGTWVEGSFYCNAASKRSGEKISVMNGFFRVAAK